MSALVLRCPTCEGIYAASVISERMDLTVESAVEFLTEDGLYPEGSIPGSIWQVLTDDAIRSAEWCIQPSVRHAHMAPDNQPSLFEATS